jgi:DNA-binding transcriptional ArsR family regulator
MNPFEVLSDPVRRRILELIGSGEMTSGFCARVISRRSGRTLNDGSIR